MTTLKTFQLVCKEEVISPIMTTTREFGRWFESTYDEYTSREHLYVRAKKGNKIVLESHPGTRIGSFFDKNNFHKPTLHSWFILQDSSMMDRIVSYGMAELRDAIPISVNDEKHRNMIRVYTIEQIECYIRSTIDRNFIIAPYIDVSRQVAVKPADMDKLIKPRFSVNRRSLFQ